MVVLRLCFQPNKLICISKFVEIELQKYYVGLCGLFGVIATSCQDYQGNILPDNLVCEYPPNPQATDSPTPRLEWVDRPVDPQTRGVKRTAYQIEAASSRKAFNQTNYDHRSGLHAERIEPCLLSD